MTKLRVLSPDDWQVWRRLRLAALAEAPYAFGSRLADWQGEGDRAERWRDRLELPGSYNVVALLDEQPVGMASGVPADEPGVVELISMWVSPAARGRGVGDRLIQAVEQWARQGQAKVLRLSVMQGNEAAERLYQRCGFVGTGVLSDVMLDGVCREDVMERCLDESHPGANATPACGNSCCRSDAYRHPHVPRLGSPAGGDQLQQSAEWRTGEPRWLVT